MLSYSRISVAPKTGRAVTWKERINELLDAKRWSFTDLANAMGASRQTISTLLGDGKRQAKDIKSEDLSLIARLLNTSVEYIVNGKPPMDRDRLEAAIMEASKGRGDLTARELTDRVLEIYEQSQREE